MREIKLRSYSSIDEKFYYFFDGLYHEKIINGEYLEVDAYKFDWSKAEQYIDLNDVKGNYTVKVSGIGIMYCETVDEVWDAIGQGRVGSLYYVYSEIGLDCTEFIPY